MRYKTYSKEYKTVRIGYPKDLNLKCPLCEHDVKYEYANSGKIVHTLNGDINQVMNLYMCLYMYTNKECEFHNNLASQNNLSIGIVFLYLFIN